MWRELTRLKEMNESRTNEAAQQNDKIKQMSTMLTTETKFYPISLQS